MRLSLLFALCMCMSIPRASYAGKTKRLYKLMDEGEYVDALKKSVAYLDTEKVRPDEKEVRLIMDRAAYFIATENNSVNAYRTYLRKFPKSAYKARVKEQLAQLEYRNLLQQKATVKQLRDFQTHHPQSSLVPDARIREEEQAWIQTRSDGSVNAIQRFKRQYPDGHFTRAAIEEEASQAYRSVQTADDLESYMAFLREYPGTRFTPEARDRSEELAWTQAEQTNNVEGYKEFRNTFQNGPRVTEAYDREIDLSWTNTKRTHKIPLYRQFGREYAAHDLALDAEKREWDLYHYERDPYPGELVPQVTRTVREDDGSYRLFLDVKDDRGRYVGGLSKDNFQIYDSGFPAELLSLEGMEADRPADVIFVIDVSGSMSDEINGVREGIKRLADLMTLRSRDLRLGLVTFVEQIYQVNGRPNGGPLTPSHDEFGRWVDSVKLETGAEENDYLALHVAAHQRFRRKAQRILVLVTDEPPSTTRQFPNSGMVADFLQAQDTTVYCVAPSHLPAYRHISKSTGGAVFNLNRTIPFTQVMEKLGQKISKQYRLRYRRPPEAPPVLDELNVRIRINREHAWVQRSGNAASKGVGTTLVAISPHDSNNVFRGLTTGGLECSENGGNTWQACGAGLPFDSTVADLLVDDKNHAQVWIRTEDGRLWRSGDNATNFEDASVNGQPATSIAQHPTISGAQLAFDGSRLWKNETGDDWEPASHWESKSPIVVMATESKGSDALLMLQNDGTLLRSTDGGENFDSIPDLPWDETTAPTGIEFHPARDGLVIAYGGNRIYRSLDDGSSWRPIQMAATGVGEDPIEIRDLVFDPTIRQMHLITTNRGVYASKDLGKTWTPSSVGMDAKTNLSSAAVGADGRVLLGTTDTNAVYSMDPVANREFVFSNLYFDSGATKPRRSLLPHLHDVAVLLRSNPQMQLLVEGHADSLGSNEVNLKISQGRAEWVRNYLTGKGVPAERIAAAWFGEDRPLVNNDSRSGRSKNRRVELVLIDDHKSIPAMDKMR